MARKNSNLIDIDSWLKKRKIKNTKQIKIPKRLVDQVIGQDEAVEVIKKASKQQRHVMLIGDPGTGKSMLARSMTELLPKGELEDVIAYHNPEDPNNPKIRVVPAGKGKEIVKAQKANAMMQKEMRSRMKLMICIMVIVVAIMAWIMYPDHPEILFFGIIAAAILYFIMRAATIKEEKELVIIPQADHNSILYFGFEIYFKSLKKFFLKLGVLKKVKSGNKEVKPVYLMGSYKFVQFPSKDNPNDKTTSIQCSWHFNERDFARCKKLIRQVDAGVYKL